MCCCAVTKMQPLIPVAVFLLCLILQNEDKLAAALSYNEFAEEGPFSFIQDADDERFARSARNPEKLHHHYIIHDWKGNMDDDWINDTSKAIRSNIDTKVVRLNWSKYAALDYISAMTAVKKFLGRRLGERIIGEYKNGKVDLDRLTIVTHGLGAHIAGIAAKKVFETLGKKVAMIIAASPAGPGFNIKKQNIKLYKDDAKCVAVIHTDQIVYGYQFPVGGLDFVANKGSLQPGCSANLLSDCSHILSRKYLIEAFYKVRPDLEQARSAIPTDSTANLIRMAGGDCSNVKGQFKFLTNSQPPYLLDE